MPEFSPGTAKTAVAPMTNPTAVPLNYRAILYMGTDMVPMSEIEFTLGPGETRDAGFSVTMPSTPGTYPVRLIVWSGELMIGNYVATEDVVITGTVSEASINTVSIPTSYEGAIGLFEAEVHVLSPAVIFLYIQEEAMPYGCDRDLILAYAYLYEADLTSPTNLYSMSQKTAMAYHWYGQTSAGWEGMTRLLPPGNYPVRGKIDITGFDEVIGSLTISGSSVSSFVYSESYLDVYSVPGSSWLQKVYGVTITNMGAEARTADIACWIGSGHGWSLRAISTIILTPGQSYEFVNGPSNQQTSSTVKAFVIDDLGGESPVISERT